MVPATPEQHHPLPEELRELDRSGCNTGDSRCDGTFKTLDPFPRRVGTKHQLIMQSTKIMFRRRDSVFDDHNRGLEFDDISQSKEQTRGQIRPFLTRSCSHALPGCGSETIETSPARNDATIFAKEVDQGAKGVRGGKPVFTKSVKSLIKKDAAKG